MSCFLKNINEEPKQNEWLRTIGWWLISLWNRSSVYLFASLLFFNVYIHTHMHTHISVCFFKTNVSFTWFMCSFSLFAILEKNNILIPYYTLSFVTGCHILFYLILMVIILHVTVTCATLSSFIQREKLKLYEFK